MLPKIAYISEISEDEERRGKTRRTVHVPTASDEPAWGPRAVLLDLSETGLRLQCHSPPALGETLIVELPRSGRVAAHVVWRSGDQCGAEFEQPIGKGVVSAAVLSSPPRERPVVPVRQRPEPVANRAPLRAEWALLALMPLVLLLLFALAYLPVSEFGME